MPLLTALRRYLAVDDPWERPGGSIDRRDVALTAATAILSLVTLELMRGVGSLDQVTQPAWLQWVLTAGPALLLLARRRWPLAVLVVGSVAYWAIGTFAGLMASLLSTQVVYFVVVHAGVAWARRRSQMVLVVGAVLLRVAVGRTTGRDPWSVAVDRTCDDCGRPHGRPAVEGVHVSVAHAGPLVLVATAAGPVGVDVESARRGPDVAEWVRQEAAFKAHGSRDGDGLHVQPLVTPLPGHAAALALTRPGEVVVHDPDESSAALAAARGQAPRSAR